MTVFINFRAAFEKVSRIEIKLEGTESILDIGKVRLLTVPLPSGYDPRKYRQPYAPIKYVFMFINNYNYVLLNYIFFNIFIKGENTDRRFDIISQIY